MTITNEDWLKKVKKRDEKWETENKISPLNDFMTEAYVLFRTVKAQEIIAEELIKMNKLTEEKMRRDKLFKLHEARP